MKKKEKNNSKKLSQNLAKEQMQSTKESMANKIIIENKINM